MRDEAHEKLVFIHGRITVEHAAEARSHQASYPLPNEPPIPIGAWVKLTGETYKGKLIAEFDRPALGIVRDISHGQHPEDVRSHWYYWVEWAQLPAGVELSSEPGLIVHPFHHDILTRTNG